MNQRQVKTPKLLSKNLSKTFYCIIWWCILLSFSEFDDVFLYGEYENLWQYFGTVK